MKEIFTFLFCILTLASYPQTGGDNVYEFLNLTHSGLVTSTGGVNVSLYGDNLNMAYHNPALLNQGMDRSLALNYVNYFAGINYGLAMYSRSVPGTGNFAAGLTYLNYGSFTGADPSGLITGDFSASEYALSLIFSREIDSLFAVGINFKPVLSHLEKYTSFGFAFDIGASWHDRKKRTSAGIVIRNAGYQVTSYAGEPPQKLPFEIQAGISHRLAYAPLRFSLALRHLQKFDIAYKNDEPLTGETPAPASGFADQALRHVVLGAEIIPHRNFYFAAGFNMQRRKEMQTNWKGSAAGFTWGFGINTTWMNIEFGRATYHLAGASTNLSLILRPDRLYKKSQQT